MNYSSTEYIGILPGFASLALAAIVLLCLSTLLMAILTSVESQPRQEHSAMQVEFYVPQPVEQSPMVTEIVEDVPPVLDIVESPPEIEPAPIQELTPMSAPEPEPMLEPEPIPTPELELISKLEPTPVPAPKPLLKPVVKPAAIKQKQIIKTVELPPEAFLLIDDPIVPHQKTPAPPASKKPLTQKPPNTQSKQTAKIKMPAGQQSTTQQDRVQLAPAKPANFDAYLASLYQQIQKSRKYPARARRRGISGMVAVRFCVNHQGKAENIEVDDKGLTDLGRAALRLLESQIFAAPPPGWDTNSVIEFEINYSLR